MFEFSLDVGPLHIRFALGDSTDDATEYVDLTSDHELAAGEDYEEPEDIAVTGFRGTRR